MSESLSLPVVLDSTVLSNFASSDAVNVVSTVFPDPATTPRVEQELEQGVDEGYTFLQRAIDALDETIAVLEAETPVANSIAVALDPGEAEALHVARTRGGTFASDDGDARAVATDMSVPVTGSLGVLVRAVTLEYIDRTTADTWLTE
jgi:predicted nucleic acid-binding protein